MTRLADVLGPDEMKDAPEEPFPCTTSPMLATLVHEAFSDEGWLYERKLEGIRLLARIENGEAELTTRNGTSRGSTYPEIVEALEAADAPDLLADGEVAAFEGDVTSYDDESLEKLRARMERLERKTSPFDAGDPPGDAGVHWITPEMVAEVGFNEWTQAGRLRHPRFLGLRDDKPPEDVVRERPEEAA